ncbi:hypothetical protein [Aneurinibacillus sp. REN35]|uniref:hypothetical protein n=1 Tax=Aneurinibacillus sp. REN35 TaxID=3237286 RepID=UPI0035274965
MIEDKELARQVRRAFEEFAGRKVREKVIEVTVRHAQRIRQAHPALSIEEVIDQAILQTVKDGIAF